jgi:YVTN family beta-propeller protein
VTAVEQPVRVGDALERERLLHVDPEPALFDEFDETSQGDRVRVDRDATEAQAGRLELGGSSGSGRAGDDAGLARAGSARFRAAGAGLCRRCRLAYGTQDRGRRATADTDLRHQLQRAHGVGDRHHDQHGDATIPVGAGPVGVAVSPGGTRVYVANNASTTVSVISTATNTVIATIPVGAFPIRVAVGRIGATPKPRQGPTRPNRSAASAITTQTNAIGADITQRSRTPERTLQIADHEDD